MRVLARASRWRELPGLLIALAFCGAGLVMLEDFGVTWDEWETQQAALLNVDILLGDAPLGAASMHELPGYYFVFDAIRGLAARFLVSRQLFDFPSSIHLVHLILASLSILILFGLTLRVSGSARAGVFAAVSLALMPKFLAHSQNNPKDLPGLFTFLLALTLVVVWGFEGGAWRGVVAGAALGLALTTNVVNIAVLPVALLWLVCTRKWKVLRDWRSHGRIAGTAGVAFFLSWPWLWPDPVERLRVAYEMLTTFTVSERLTYCGRLYDWTTAPWHYFLGSFVVATPILFLLLAAAIAGLWIPRGARLPQNEGLRSLAVLGLVWCGTLTAMELLSPTRYDGVRHFLAFLPGFSLLIAAGTEASWRAISHRAARSPVARRWIGVACVVVGVALGATFLSVVRMHPYYDAYLNEPVNLAIGQHAERWFELEYWGNSYKEGAGWLNQVAEPDAIFHYVWTPQASYHLRTPAVPFDEGFFSDTSRPRYLMLMTRSALYDEAIWRVVREYRPVFSIQRQRATLLNIYKNTERRDPSSRASGDER